MNDKGPCVMTISQIIENSSSIFIQTYTFYITRYRRLILMCQA